MTVFFLSMFACSGGSTDVVGDAAAGEAVYTANCASCHLADGTGSAGPDITGMSDLTRVEDVVISGDGSMPAFGDTLSDQDIADVAEYVLTL